MSKRKSIPETSYATMIHEETMKVTRTTENGKFYDGILEAVKNSGKSSLRVDLPEKLQPKSAYYGFKARLKDNSDFVGFKAHLADNKVFIVKE